MTKRRIESTQGQLAWGTPINDRARLREVVDRWLSDAHLNPLQEVVVENASDTKVVPVPKDLVNKPVAGIADWIEKSKV